MNDRFSVWPQEAESRATDAAPILVLRDLRKAYRTPAGDFYALKGIDLEIWPGEFVALLGRSGAGKSTLINMLAGIDRPTAGEIWIEGKPIHRLSESKFTAPHFYLTVEINMDKAISLRTRLNEVSPVKLSFNDLVIKAAAAALRQHPGINASWLGDKIRYHHEVNIGVAVAIEEGLLVPVIRNADIKTLSQINTEVKNQATKAKERKLQPEEMQGNTFTISNLGMFGIEEFTAIINPPNACILAVGAIRDVPVVEHGAVVPGKRMKVTLSSDHRVVDGAVAAQFLNTLRGYLENPATMLL